MKLIRYSIVGSILSWSRIIVSSLKDGLPVDGLVIGLFFQRHSPDGIHRMRFIFCVKLVVVHSWTHIVDCFFLEPGSFGVEVALAAHVVTCLFAGFKVVLAWAWHFLFFELFDLAEAVS